MPSGLGILIMPVSILLLLRKDTGPVAKLMKAGATSPESSRRPATLGITRHFLVADAVKRGLLVAVGDGRYYVDHAAYRRSRRISFLVSAAIALAIIGLGLWIWSPWSAA